MNNYPHCFPTNRQIAEKVKELFKIDFDESKITPDKVVWGMTDWDE